MISVSGRDPEAQMIKNDKIYKHFGVPGGKYTAKTMLLQLLGVPTPPPAGIVRTPLWATLGGPKTAFIQ